MDLQEGEVAMKAGMVKQYHVGQHVSFKTGPRGCRTDYGNIVKLHPSGRYGSAEIRTNGAVGLPSKVTRSLQYVDKV